MSAEINNVAVDADADKEEAIRHSNNECFPDCSFCAEHAEALDSILSENVAKCPKAMSAVTVTEMLAVVVQEYLHEYQGYDESDFIDFVVTQTHGSNGTRLLDALPFGSEGLIAFYEKRITHLRDWVAQTNKEDERDTKVGRK